MHRSVVVSGVMAVLVGALPAAAQTVPEPSASSDISVTLSGPTDLMAGDTRTFTISVDNDGPDLATGASVSLSLPEGLDSTSLAATDPVTQCRWEDYAYATPEGSTDASPGYGGVYAVCDLGDLTAGETRQIDLGIKRTRAHEMYLAVWAGAYEGDPNYDNNYAERLLSADTSRPANLGVSVRGPQASVGDIFPLRLTASNAGPSVAEQVDLTTWLPDGTEIVSVPNGCTDDSEGPQSGSHPEFWMPATVTCHFDAIPAAEKRTVEIELRRTSGWELYGSAWIGSLNFDGDPMDDYTSWTLPSDPSVTSDLYLDATAPTEDPLVGDTFTIAYTVGNSGPTGAGDVLVSDYLAYGLTFVSATPGCTFTDYGITDPQPAGEGPTSSEDAQPIYYGGGYVSCDLGFIEPKTEQRVEVTYRRDSAYPLYDYAYVGTSNYDPRYENNYAETFLDADRTNSADISVKVAAPQDVAVGDAFRFTIAVENLGTQAASGVVLNDYIAEGLEFRAVDRADICTYEGEGEGTAPQPDETSPTYSAPRDLICSIGALEPGASASIEVEAVRTSEWSIWNGAWVYTETFDPDYENDYAYFELPGDDPYTDCAAADGTAQDDQIVSDTCPVETGAGMDSVGIEVGTSAEDRTVSTGIGADVINIDIGTGSSHRRTIEVHSGRGADTINVTIGSVAGLARIVLFGGTGADSVNLDVAPGALDVVFVVRLGSGEDVVRYLRYGDRNAPPLRAWGGPGADRVVGGQGSDRIWGGVGRDVIDAGTGDDVVMGGRGHDTCIDGPGADSVDC